AVPRIVGHVHLDEDVAGEEALRRHDLLAGAHLDDVLGRDEHVADLVLQAVRPDALLERFLHLVLEARVGVDDVPVFRGGVAHCRHAPTPNLRMIQITRLSMPKSRANRYRPKKIDTRITTTVVAYTSFCDGHVTRLSSLRTSLRNRRA